MFSFASLFCSIHVEREAKARPSPSTNPPAGAPSLTRYTNFPLSYAFWFLVSLNSSSKMDYINKKVALTRQPRLEPLGKHLVREKLGPRENRRGALDTSSLYFPFLKATVARWQKVRPKKAQMWPKEKWGGQKKWLIEIRHNCTKSNRKVAECYPTSFFFCHIWAFWKKKMIAEI